MSKSLLSMTKAELISAVQDYQEMVSELESHIDQCSTYAVVLMPFREIIEKWVLYRGKPPKPEKRETHETP